MLFSSYITDLSYYFQNPEIDIVSPQSGEIINFDSENCYCEIYGNSNGIVNNQFVHLLFLGRRIDSNQKEEEWFFLENYYKNGDPYTLYTDGNWSCRFLIDDFYTEWINETAVIKSPNNSSNNISTHFEFAVVVLKQPLVPSILARLATNPVLLMILNIDNFENIEWLENIFLGHTNTFYYFNFFDSYDFISFNHYNEFTFIPKKVADAHVIIEPKIATNIVVNWRYRNPHQYTSPYAFDDVYAIDLGACPPTN
ncbi:MAG: hypothetical protein K8R19_12065 [Methanosarcinales archaeon]|nr:hypothetical protein [Methanosarcinales archaeon]